MSSGLDSAESCNKMLEQYGKDEVLQMLHHCDDERIFVVYRALKLGVTPDEIFDITKIDRWFLYKLLNLVRMEAALSAQTLTDELYLQAKHAGFLDSAIEKLSGQTIANKRYAAYKMVDTCAAEFDAKTPYFYSTFDEQNEAAEFIEQHQTGRKRVIVFVRRADPHRPGRRVRLLFRSLCYGAEKTGLRGDPGE